MTDSKIYRDWCDRIDSGTFTPGQCRQWAQAVFALAQGDMPGGMRTNLTGDDARTLLECITARGGVRLTREHEAKGIDWLIKYAAKRLPNLPSDIMERFSHFLFLGSAVDARGGQGYRSQYVPVWRIVTTDGEEWDYYATSWQGGVAGDDAWMVTPRRVNA